MRRTLFLSAFAVTLSAATANAHILLDDPPTRTTGMKTGPCGSAVPRTTDPNKIRTYRPGQQITVRWHETVVHAGYFRVAFSNDSVTFPADPGATAPAVAFPILAVVTKIAGTTDYSAQITLPNTECAACSIQVIQYMSGRADPYYYQCGDIVLSSSAPIGGAGGASNGGTASGGASSGGAASAGAGSTNGGVAGSVGAGGSAGGVAGSSGIVAPPGGSGGTSSGSGGTSGGATSAGAGGATSAGAAGEPAEPGDDEGGCGVAPGRSRGALGALGLALAAALLVRRRQPRPATRA